MANRLTGESSPYLRQHARNPVDWYPWGDEAIERAAAENKVLIVSIGYSSCHWCHVMERESFEDPETAGMMNESFVSIKVDREERPDIDAHYMNALQLMNGQGGWPLNIFALPDGRAFYGGTYFPRGHWMQLLAAVRDKYGADPRSLEETAGKVEEGIRDFKLRMLEPDPAALDMADLERAVKESRRMFDLRDGGRKGSPKFPNPVWLRFLLAWSRLRDDPDSRDFVLLTLDRMAAGGLYDQIGGGFARYAVDSLWKVPHFEKMLYDNAQLISLYADAYKLTGNGSYARIVRQSMEFVTESMASSEGPFYSALDADSEGEEGRYYLWTEEELSALLGEDYPFAARCYRIGREGLWEGGRNILLLPEAPADDSEEGRRLEDIRLRLKEKRGSRIAPALDDKILVSWNALMIRACCDAYDALGREEYLQLGQKAADFILSTLRKSDGSLYRVYREGTPYVDAFFEDYAHLSGALVSLFQSSGDPLYLEEALGLTEKSIELFYDEEQKIFFNRPEAEGSVQREAELSDGILPSPNAATAQNLFRLSLLTGNAGFRALSEGLLNRMSCMIGKNILFFSHWAELALYRGTPFYEAVVAGDEARTLSAELRAAYVPNALHAHSVGRNEDLPLFQGRFSPDETLIYICRDDSCGLPLKHAEDALARMAPEARGGRAGPDGP